MDDSEHDVLAYIAFPAQHRTKLHSTNPLKRLNKEVKRRAPGLVRSLATTRVGEPVKADRDGVSKHRAWRARPGGAGLPLVSGSQPGFER